MAIIKEQSKMIPERLTLGFRLDLESIELACEK